MDQSKLETLKTIEIPFEEIVEVRVKKVSAGATALIISGGVVVWIIILQIVQETWGI